MNTQREIAAIIQAAKEAAVVMAQEMPDHPATHKLFAALTDSDMAACKSAAASQQQDGSESAVSAPSDRELLEAKRYRWLRDVARGVDWSEYISPTAYAYRCRTSAKEMDDSIDFAIRAHLGEKT